MLRVWTERRTLEMALKRPAELYNLGILQLKCYQKISKKKLQSRKCNYETQLIVNF